jgi:photosystem II stability/assembly factor-like uncharacterized protein
MNKEFFRPPGRQRFNMSLKKIIFFISFFSWTALSGQEIKIISEGPKRSFRGMSVVDDKVVWISGSEGTVGRSLNGGKAWEWMKVEGYEKCDFRDIEAFGKNEAVIMAVAEPAYILKTTDGGKSWKKVYENATPGMFLDAMDFSEDGRGIVVGDPVNGRFVVLKTKDKGQTWLQDAPEFSPVADSAEACFASSGTNIRFYGSGNYIFVSGGNTTHAIIAGRTLPLPLLNGKGSTGANSIAVKNAGYFIVAGGDFTEADSAKGNCAYSSDGGQSWNVPEVPPHGYRSCVEYLWKDTWICCGLNGVDLSTDNGKTWKQISSSSFHVCRKAKKGSVVFLIGADGRIGRLMP